MTRGFSRRNLVKGAAWAAPAVVASTAIPAYSASIMDLAPCLHFDLEPGEDSAYGLRQYMHEVAPERTPRERAVEDITIPDGVSYMRFYIEGGQGGGVDMDDYSGGSGGYGAEVSGVIAVTPGQKYRFYLAAGGIGHYYEPADGGDGYTRGGSSALMPEYVYEDSDKERMTSADYNRLIIYSGSGGGSSALVLLDGDAETLIAVAGGGGGGGARGIIATSRTNLPDGAKMPTWRQFDPDVPKWAPRYSPPYLGNGGDGGESKASKPSKTLKRYTPSTAPAELLPPQELPQAGTSAEAHAAAATPRSEAPAGSRSQTHRSRRSAHVVSQGLLVALATSGMAVTVWPPTGMSRIFPLPCRKTHKPTTITWRRTLSLVAVAAAMAAAVRVRPWWLVHKPPTSLRITPNRKRTR